MATYTAGDQINRALRLLGVLAEDETPSAATSADALMALDQMIESWSTERLSVFSTQDQVTLWPVGEINATLGPTGSLVSVNPLETFGPQRPRVTSATWLPIIWVCRPSPSPVCS